jgi:hypothetical protein
MDKHTPGPWAIDQDLSGAPVILPTLENGRFAICAMYGPQKGHNARLIAAAPELLEALKNAIEIIEGTGLDASIQRAAITKATEDKT